MGIVDDIYKANYDISELELADEVLKHKELTTLDLWLLPRYPFDVWRRKYDYPRLLESIKRRRPDFIEWMEQQGITEEHLLNGHLSDFFEHKPLSGDTLRYLVKVTWKGQVNMQCWHGYDPDKLEFTKEVKYDYIKSFISYYDWILETKKYRFSFMDELDRILPNTDKDSYM
jgi:hypothetical protein